VCIWQRYSIVVEPSARWYHSAYLIYIFMYFPRTLITVCCLKGHQVVLFEILGLVCRNKKSPRRKSKNDLNQIREKWFKSSQSLILHKQEEVGFYKIKAWCIYLLLQLESEKSLNGEIRCNCCSDVWCPDIKCN